MIVDRPRASVHLNTYMILVSESGIMRKSTSIRAAANLVRDFLLKTNSPMQLVESQITKGALLDDLSRSSLHHGSAQVVIVASELAAMLGRGSQISGVPAMLTDLYDCPDERTGGGSIHSGTINLSNVYCSFLAGSTPSWLERSVRPEIIAGGFTSRCYFVTGRVRKKLVAWPAIRHETDTREQLVTTLQEIAHESKAYSGSELVIQLKTPSRAGTQTDHCIETRFVRVLNRAKTATCCDLLDLWQLMNDAGTSVTIMFDDPSDSWQHLSDAELTSLLEQRLSDTN